VSDHGWRGSGRFRVARLGAVLLVRFGNVSTKKTRLKADIGAFFRKEYRAMRPSFGPYRVHIWMEGPNLTRRIDADNIAKACLDALTGIVWRDDSQVTSLAVEKVEAETEAVSLKIEKCKHPTPPDELHHLLATADGLP